MKKSDTYYEDYEHGFNSGMKRAIEEILLFIERERRNAISIKDVEELMLYLKNKYEV